MSPKKNNPKASAWDKISQQSAGESNANRDVYENQQLDRSTIEGRKSKTPRTVGAVILGVFAGLVFWTVFSLIHMLFVSIDEGLGLSDESLDAPEYYTATDGTTLAATEYRHVDPDGEVMENSPTFDSREEAEANPPDWYLEWEEEALAEIEASNEADRTDLEGFGDFWLHVNMFKLLLVSVAALGVFLSIHTVLMRKLEAQNLMHDTSDINQYQGDQHIALPREVMKKFSLFPDVGAHSDVQPSSLISHVMLTNKGVNQIKVSQRAEKDSFDTDGDIEYYKGEILRNDEGAALMKTAPVIDEDFGDDLFDASGLPSGKDKDGKKIRRKYNPDEIEYNPEGKPAAIGGKTGSYKTIAELINKDWHFPEYEVQRPAGVYIVDEAPVNTMVLAITRAGKGQTYIEPMIDMWLREKRPNNMVVNDPKGELLVKNYVRATMRGYQVVQFNLINAMKTDIYNPLEMAAQAARAGDITKCAMYVENIADVFFPVDGGDDPVWPNAANNAFKRAAYGLIDFYLEEERELRAYALRTGMDPKVLDGMLDERWGKVTLYNCYQLFVQLTSKKVKNPVKQLKSRYDSGEFGTAEDFDEAAFEEAEKEAEAKDFMWDGADEIDQLTLYFNATQALPRNSLRDLVANADNALRAMGAAEKMLASVYGIAITAMSFFTDPTIATLTSGRPSQNVDLAGMSFPRRIGVRFHMNYLSREQFIGAQVKWDAYADEKFEEKLEGDFDHEDIVSREGWARYYFKGIFPQDTVYLRLRLLNSQTGMLLRTFYFRFTKDYQTTLDGRRFVSDPITGEKIVKDGTLVELKGIKADGSKPRRGESFEKLVLGRTVFPEERLVNLTMGAPEKEWGESVAIITNSVRYSEKPKAVFLVTPPHLMKYAKLVLILVKQLVDLNFDQSYMTKSNQKPLYKTRFMLDELGNLQSEGQGISGFETMLSIGLGQEQQFTIILQTLQQLRDVYGESVDKIVQGNAQPLTALVATPEGFKPMGEIEVGDEVLTPKGGTTEVDGVYPQGQRKVYKVTRADGASTEACDEHLWDVIIEPPKS